MNTKRGRGATEKAAKGMTDWNQLKALPDSDVVLTDDAPGTMPDDWADAVAHRGLPLPSRKAQEDGCLAEAALQRIESGESTLVDWEDVKKQLHELENYN